MTPTLLFLVSAWVQLSGPAGANCRSIDINPLDRRILLCCTWNGSHGGVFRSTDAGNSWSTVTGIPREQGAGMNAIRFCPTDPSIAVCGSKIIGTNGLFLSTDAGLSWSQTGFPPGYAEDICWPPGGRDTFYVVSGTGLQKTADLGQNWQLVFSRTYCWRAGFRPGSQDTVFVGGLYGLYRSFDAGVTWDTSSFRKRCYDFEFDPLDPDTIFVGGHVYGVFKVWDNGEAWDSLGNADHYNTSIRIDTSDLSIWTGGFAFSPVSGRITVSHDRGLTWNEFGPDRLFDPVCNDICLPQGDSVIYAAGEYFGPQRFSRSDSIWHASALGIHEANVRAIHTAAGVIYAAGSVMGVSRSDDAGLTWRTAVNTPVCGLFHNTEMWPPGLVCSATNPDTVYACFQGHVPFLDSVYRSTDRGSAWTGFQVPGLAEYDRLNLLDIHPFGPETLYLSSSAGVHKSTDAGQNWFLVDTFAAYCVTVDPHQPSTVYSGWIGRARRSTDAGATWFDFSAGLPRWSETMNIEPDPDSAGILFAAMCGGEARDPLSGIYLYRETADSWTRVSNGLPGAFVLRPRVAVDSVLDCLWCVLPNQGAQVYRSSDRGDSWHAADTGFLAYGAYYVHSDARTYIGTRADGIWVWDAGSGLSAGTSTRPKPGLHTVLFGDVLESGPGFMRVFDLAGRMVAQGRTRLDTRHLEPGVYFVTNGTLTVKALKPR
ncbi:MAG: hypothetical protein JSU73_01120 [candidate division WOR-3 bacterium]|nr:MAG: hypothetical protein JSU73_01120 [candidate division WOR-3 bacterium]